MTTPYPLGRNLEHDPRSRNFPAPRSLAQPGDVVWKHYGRVLDQGNLGSCTGNAAAAHLMTAPLRKVGRYLHEDKAIRLYRLATILDEFPGQYPPDDTGSSGNAVAKAARQVGYITSWTHAFGYDHALAAITHGPFIVGTNWYESMFSPDSSGILTVEGSVVGGHEYACIGHDNGRWGFVQSWGYGWGVINRAARLYFGGGFYLKDQDFARLLSEDGDVTQFVV